ARDLGRGASRLRPLRPLTSRAPFDRPLGRRASGARQWGHRNRPARPDRAYAQDLGCYPLDLGCKWLRSGDRNAWVGIAEASSFPVDRSDPPWAKAHPSLEEDKDDRGAAWRACGDWKERLRAVASGSYRASDALERGGAWNAYVRAIAGFMSGMAPVEILATDYLAYDDASTGKN
ncbi:hypothetical protein MKK75_34825, partial [Methylobacterium sp. J-030]|nr:hypothetical protein [Methylobacterium sp. J-030]